MRPPGAMTDEMLESGRRKAAGPAWEQGEAQAGVPWRP